MKKILPVCVFLTYCLSAFGQLEFKTNPAYILLSAVPVSFEKNIADRWGIEFDGLVAEYGQVLYLSAKYYHKPPSSSDGLYFGVFTGFFNLEEDDYGSADSFGVGALLGYKYLFWERFLAEVGAGAGFDFNDTYPFLPHAKILIGYRFGG